jgi:hypothetical protein
MNAKPGAKKHKHYSLDESKILKAKKLLGVKTETEAIETALDEVIADREHDKRAWASTERLLKSVIKIEDVFNRLV